MSPLDAWQLGRFEGLAAAALAEHEGAEEAVAQIGERLQRVEHQGWQSTWTSHAEHDTEVALLWAGWFGGDPWGIRPAWEKLFLGRCESVFRGVLRARGVPRDAWERCIDELREAFFFQLLGARDATPGWIDLASRVIEEADGDPVVSLSKRLDRTRIGWLAGCACRRGTLAKTAACVWPEMRARGRTLRIVELASSGDLRPLVDLHVLHRVLATWADQRREAEQLWSVVLQNRGRARARLRALVAELPPAILLEDLMGLDALHHRSQRAVSRQAWAWATREVSRGFSFDVFEVTPRCVAEEASQPIPADALATVRTWVLLVALRDRLGHLERWASTGSTGDRDTSWGRLLQEVPAGLRDAQARSYERLRLALRESLADEAPWLRERLSAVAGLDARKRGLKGLVEAALPDWDEDVQRPKSGFPSMVEAASRALETLDEVEARWHFE